MKWRGGTAGALCGYKNTDKSKRLSFIVVSCEASNDGRIRSVGRRMRMRKKYESRSNVNVNGGTWSYRISNEYILEAV